MTRAVWIACAARPRGPDRRSAPAAVGDERVRHQRDQPRRLGPLARAVRALGDATIVFEDRAAPRRGSGAGPGEARKAAMPARIEKSAKSPSVSICASGSMPALAREDRAAPRCARRGQDRAAARPHPARSRRRRRRRAAPGRGGGRRLGVQQQCAQRRMPALGALAFEQAERVAHLRRDRRRPACRAARRPPIARAPPTTCARCPCRWRWMLSWIVRTYAARRRQATTTQPTISTRFTQRRAAQVEAEAGTSGTRPSGCRRPPRRRASGDRRADDVDRVLERQAVLRRQRQIEQLVGRPIDREAERPGRTRW